MISGNLKSFILSICGTLPGLQTQLALPTFLSSEPQPQALAPWLAVAYPKMDEAIRLFCFSKSKAIRQFEVAAPEPSHGMLVKSCSPLRKRRKLPF